MATQITPQLSKLENLTGSSSARASLNSLTHSLSPLRLFGVCNHDAPAKLDEGKFARLRSAARPSRPVSSRARRRQHATKHKERSPSPLSQRSLSSRRSRTAPRARVSSRPRGSACHVQRVWRGRLGRKEWRRCYAAQQARRLQKRFACDGYSQCRRWLLWAVVPSRLENY